jgi:hypothetical protein
MKRPPHIQHRLFGDPPEVVLPPPAPSSFFFHYNKPASQRAKKPQISVHWQGACQIVDNIDVQAPTWGRVRKRQPYFVMVGCGLVTVRDGVAYITG